MPTATFVIGSVTPLTAKVTSLFAPYTVQVGEPSGIAPSELGFGGKLAADAEPASESAATTLAAKAASTALLRLAGRIDGRTTPVGFPSTAVRVF